MEKISFKSSLSLKKKKEFTSVSSTLIGLHTPARIQVCVLGVKCTKTNMLMGYGGDFLFCVADTVVLFLTSQVSVRRASVPQTY